MLGKWEWWPYRVNISLFEGNNRNSRKRRQICSKLAIKTPEQQRTCSGVLIVLILIYLTPFSTVCILDFEQVNVCLVKLVKEITNIK